jgi:hypothetical protein
LDEGLQQLIYDNIHYQIHGSASVDWIAEHWTTLIGPAVIAAVISGVVAVVGFFITTRAATAMHREKLAFDRQLAERRFEFDRDLAKQKFQYDRDLHDHKRRVELAEEVLSDFYQAHDIINTARSPGSFAHEGATRQKAEWESEDDTSTLNAYFATYERLRNKAEFFAQLHARRYRFMAHFGLEAAKPYDELHKIYNEIVIAVRMLVNTYRRRTEGLLPKNREAWERTIGWAPDEHDKIPDRL